MYYAAIMGAVALATLFGFFITYGTSSQAAWARLFVDLGALTAIGAFLAALPRPEPLHTDVIVDAIRDLARGRYHTRIVGGDLGELDEIAQAFNELAGSLSDRVEIDLAEVRKPPQPLVPRPPVPSAELEHSYHPELGPVKAAHPSDEAESVQLAAPPAPPPPPPQTVETAPQRGPYPTIIPVASKPEELTSYATNDGLEEVIETVHEQAPLVSLTREPSEELFDLYDAFAKALHAHSQEMISYDTFKETIDHTRHSLMSTHHCKDVKFEIVTEGGEVALRPRLVR